MDRLVSLWVIFLFGISARQVLEPLGAVGTPALGIATVGAGWWVASRVDPSIGGDHERQPLRTLIVVYAWYLLLTYAIGHMRPLTTLEQTGSVRTLVMMYALLGMALLIMDGVTDLASLRSILRKFVWGGTFIATLGALQAVAEVPVDLPVPGLVFNRAPMELGTRSLFLRPFATTLHPIELSVVLGALFPLALHFALNTQTPVRQRRFLAVAATIIGLGIPLSISRSGVVVVLVSMSVMLAGWPWRRRLNAILVGGVAVSMLWLSVPGLVGTLKSLFTGASNDPSIRGRLADVPHVWELIKSGRWFGRGIGTFSVDDYFVVDNEFYVSTIEIGFIGIVLTLSVLVLACLEAWSSRSGRLADDESRQLALALIAGIAGIMVSLATFDAFHYHILTGCLFVMVGACGALWRLTHR